MLAALEDCLCAWKGLGSSITSIWRGRRLGGHVQFRLFLTLMYFVASSVLYIVGPATITIESFNTTVPVLLDVVRLHNVSDDALSSLNENSYRNRTITSLGFLPYAMEEKDSLIAVPPGVEQRFICLTTLLHFSRSCFVRSIWFSTSRNPGSQNITFTDSAALRPSIKCASIPPHPGDQFGMVYYSSGAFMACLLILPLNMSTLRARIL